MWPDNISAGKKCVCIQHSVNSRNVENKSNEEPCKDESRLDRGISLSNDNDVIPSNNDLRDTATHVIEKRRATPEVGMTFDSFEAVDEFYSAFGKAMGFGVNLGGHKKDAITNEKRYQYWHCECGPAKTKLKNTVEGERIESPVGTSRRRKKSKKYGCGAGMAAFLNKDGLWEIHKVESTHTNHAPSPSKSRYVPTFRDVPKFVIRIVKDLIDAGVKQSQIYHALANQLEGFENIPFLLKDMHNAVQKDRCKEFDEQDFNLNCGKTFQKVYTDAKFREVQHECFSLMYCPPKGETKLTEHVTEYTIEDRIQVRDPVHHVSKELKVVLDRENSELRCTYRLFEHRGILCRHCIRVMEMTNMPLVTEKHVLQRWRKDIKRKHLDINVGFNDPDKTVEEIRYGVLQYEYEKVFQLVASSPELCDHTVSKAHELALELEELHRGCSSTETRNDGIPSSQASAGNLEDGPMVGEGVENPPVGKRIGRPPVKTPYGYSKQKKSKGSSNSKESTEESVNMPPQGPFEPTYRVPHHTNMSLVHGQQSIDLNTPVQVQIPFHNDQVQRQSNSASVAHDFSHGHFSGIYPSWEVGCTMVRRDRFQICLCGECQGMRSLHAPLSQLLVSPSSPSKCYQVLQVTICRLEQGLQFDRRLAAAYPL
ncbi:Protein FAR-RED ELONGATED HYPOCOTYL 3, partial [Bienertia sinuspersici]